MLSRPRDGMSVFTLENYENSLELFDSDDIANNWLDMAIFGLENKVPFCLKATIEQGRILILVSYHYLRIIDDYYTPKTIDEVEVVDCNMIEFCQHLYDDLFYYIDLWAMFGCNSDDDIEHRISVLEAKLDRLKALMYQNESILFE